MNARNVQLPSRLVLDERAHVVAREFFPAGQELQLDDEGEADHLAAQPFDQTDNGARRAVVRLVEELGGEVVGLAFVVELEFLPGREKLAGYDVRSLIKYQS